MSLVIQIGQCGNQVGYRFFKMLEEYFNSKECPKDSKFGKNIWFTNGSPNVILVDKEPKVINSLYDKKIDEGNILYEQSGASNSWSIGYYNNIQGRNESGINTFSAENTTLSKRTIEAMRKHLIKATFCNTVFVLHSLVGGTGGGFTSRLLEEIRQEFNNLRIVTVSIWPFWEVFNETSLQSTGICLSIAMLSEYSDLSLLFFNDKLLQITSKAHIFNPHLCLNSNSDLVEMNDMIGRTLQSLIVPTKEAQIPSDLFSFSAGTDCLQFAQTGCSVLRQGYCEYYDHELGVPDAIEMFRRTIPMSLIKGEDPLFSYWIRAFNCGGPALNNWLNSKMLPSVAGNVQYLNQGIAPQWKLNTGLVGVFHSSSWLVPLENAISDTTEMLEQGAYIHLLERDGMEIDDLNRAVDRCLWIYDKWKDLCIE
eukprot:TRINITY_DN730_c0_g1_i1.p1 TRINITY_DN730_c0_g1~~TRINITY_DN730_c0_g1_i1.p1  ORF type:complete len:423 (-),score=85.44 TRINITY_DN730_c0_g1_i1:7-1275(-)